ncbi:tetratricopeptide repeat protein [Aquisalinus flavus]|uniref:DUF1570 domain-containing protein n=1 Tax=Aquisalinus flavus TaxID=1526572 RepID=A0A8J2Y399_9PROT|nr:hypothetical protein [Aquisalinus flavus]MBD0427463.1 hypothetical protein [Aquisalinus flavus]UNE47263.1 hypothetical protein FF099_03910 [Aquisalinus flavus]GGD01207.1 hypothetical protein GCM10011342_07760 [Aquisalinus flavus]
MFRNLVAAFCALLVMTGPALAKWHEVKTENFTVRGDASLDTLQDMALELERFRIFLGYIYANHLPEREPVNVPVYVMRDERSFKELFPANNVGGVFTSRIEMPIFAVNAEKDYSSSFVKGQRRDGKRRAREFIKHEYVHHFIHMNGPSYFPMWYNEGLADYYSSFEYKDGLAVLGGAISERGVWLVYGEKLPWDYVFSSLRDWRANPETGSTSSYDVAMYYAQSWLAVQYLMADDTRRMGLDAYIKAINPGIVGHDARFEDSFGMTMEQMGERIDTYLDKNNLLVLQYDLTADNIQVDMQTRQLDRWEEEYHFLYGRRFFVADDEDRQELATRLEKLLDQQTGNIAVMMELAFLRLEQEDRDKANAIADRALAIDPENSMAMVIKGMTAPFVEKREWLRKAREADPENIRANYEYALTFRESAVPEALEAAIQVMHSSANRLEVPMLVGEMLINLEYYEEARRILEPLAAWSYDGRDRSQAEWLLSRIPEEQETAEAVAE